jgi:hypothetical protein
MHEGKMTSKPPERDYKNLTLRMPDEFHRQLSSQADRSGLTMNAHLINIVRGHLMDSGYFPNVIKSASGRLFEVDVTEIPQGNHSTRYFCSRFDINEYHPLYTKRRAHYIFGLANQLSFGDDPYGAVKDVGIALLNFYNRQMLEIDQLAWQQNATDPDSPSPTLNDNWRYIGSGTTKNVAEFLVAIKKNHWKDPQLVLTGKSQDLRHHLRSEEDLYSRSGRSTLGARHADFERYALDAAQDWIREHGGEEMADEFACDYYNTLPRYVQRQIDVEEYHAIMLRCAKQLLETQNQN